jgi:spore maturation protein CgeB
MVIPLATNVSRFQPGAPNPTFECDYAFTGNNWGHGRDLIPLLDVRPGEKFMMFGKDWDKDPRTERYWRGHLEYGLLPELYSSSKIVLDDTASPTLPYGFLNGRVFEALAAGALVITDNVEGSAEMFDGELPTYSSREDLRAQLDYYLDNEQERLGLVSKLRERVLSRHSYAARPGEFLSLARDYLRQPKVAIKIGVPNEEVKPTWGDTHFANALASGLTKLGFPTDVHILPEWDLPENQAVDVVIHLRGLTSYTPKPAHVNVLWIISHPDDVTAKECEKYDLVLVASASHAQWLRDQVATPVVFMPQATDNRRFKPLEPRKDLVTEVLFVGNSRGQNRPVVEWAVASGLPLTVYGSGWEGRIPAAYVRGEYFPNEELASLYASAKVVLNDHWPDMRDRGFISNRIYDALAAGSVVVSDPVAGLEETFGDLVPTFDDSEELENTVRRLLEDASARRDLVRNATKLVTTHHTFTQRAEELVRLLAPHLERRPREIKGSPLLEGSE